MSTQSSDAPMEAEKKQLEVAKLKAEIEKLNQESMNASESRVWWRKSVRDVKLSEWLTAAAAIIALTAAFWTGLFSAVRERLSAQADRLAMEKLDLEHQKEKLGSEVRVKEKNLAEVNGRLLPFEVNEAAMAELKALNSEDLRSEFSTAWDFSALEVTLSNSRVHQFDLATFEHPRKSIRNKAIERGLTATSRLRSLRSVRTRDLILLPSEAAFALRMPGVENVTLKNAGVSQTAFVGAAASSNLKWIHLPGNEVSSLEGLPIIESVVGLDLTGNPITDEGLARVAAVFPNLKHLNLRDTKITDNLVQQVAKVRWLTTLDLVGTKVTGKGLVALEVCPILNGIYVSKSQMTDEVRKHYDSKTDRRMQLWLPGDDPPAIKRE